MQEVKAPRFDEVFHDSFEKAVGSGAYNDAFVRRFYEKLIDRSVVIAALFKNTNMARQKTMLYDSLLLMRDFFRDRAITPQLERLAMVHSRSGVDVHPDLYTDWLDALTETVAEFDPGFSAETELAWRLVLAPGIAFMQFFYDRPKLS